MKDFAIGETLTYYPIKENKDDNRHWPCEVIATRNGRYTVSIQAGPEVGRLVRTVTAARLERQPELIERA